MFLKIETPNAPPRLILAWEAPKSSKDRLRWAIGELTAESDEPEFRYYHGDEFKQKNLGREYQQLLDSGYELFPGFFPPSRALPFKTDALEAFRRRMPPEKRQDFKQYLQHYGLSESSGLSDMSLLAITGARLPSDGFELVDPLTATAQCFDVILQIAGFRHYLDVAEGIEVGMDISLDFEPENEFDSSAIAFRFQGKTIGHVNRLQIDGLSALMSEKMITTQIMRLNGTPMHPRAYTLLKIRPTRRVIAA